MFVNKKKTSADMLDTIFSGNQSFTASGWLEMQRHDNIIAVKAGKGKVPHRVPLWLQEIGQLFHKV